jgi:hypothetical protein
VRCHDARIRVFVGKVLGEAFALHAVAVKRHITIVYGIDCLACHDEFFENNPLQVVKENDEHVDFALRLSRFSVSVSLDFPCPTNAFFPKRLSNHFLQDVCRTISEICTKFDAHSLQDPSRNRIITPNKRT